MYDELIKRLRAKARLTREYNETGDLEDDAADAIEELQEDNSALNSTVSNLIGQIAELNNPRWIPITKRPMDEEERKEWSEKRGYDIDYDEDFIYTSQLPDDGQEVLVCGRYGREWIDKFENDPDYGCCFEENGDMDGIVAWMPLPEPYKGEM